MSIRAVISDRRARTLLAFFAAACASLPSPARAEGAAAFPDPVAQALFQDALALVDRGEWDAGCTKFEASMLLYPAASTLLNIARCHEHKQKLASAWSAYKRVLVLNRETVGDERRRAIDELASAEIAKLTPRLPKIKLTMSRPVLGVTLRKDGELLPGAAIGTELPVDVGEHEVAAEAPGHRPFHLRFDVKEGVLRDVVIDLVPEGEADQRDGRPPRWAWVTGGAGLVFAGLSAGFRIDQAYVEGRQQGLCGGNVQAGCPPRPLYDPGPDNTRKNVDFAFFVGFGVAGVASLAATIYGFVRAARAPAPPVASFVVTRDGAMAAAAFQF